MITYHCEVAGTHAVSTVDRKGQTWRVVTSQKRVAFMKSARHSRDSVFCQRSARCDLTKGIAHQQRGYKTGKTVHCPATRQLDPEAVVEKLYFEPDSKTRPVLRPFYGPLKLARLPGTG